MKKITPEQKSGIIELLCRILSIDKDYRVRLRSAESLGELKDPRAISALSQAASQDPSFQVRIGAVEALVLICNYQESITIMSEQPKNQPTFNIGQVGNINTGDIDLKGDQIGIQYNYSNDPEIQAASIELKTLLSELQKQHPSITTQEQALSIIDVEFTEIKQANNRKLVKLSQFLLDPKRHFKAIKATTAEVAKHYLEESVWAKAIITYCDTFID
jgi:HEAT repeat protein